MTPPDGARLRLTAMSETRQTRGVRRAIMVR
jgi:hypothetical protein